MTEYPKVSRTPVTIKRSKIAFGPTTRKANPSLERPHTHDCISRLRKPWHRCSLTELCHQAWHTDAPWLDLSPDVAAAAGHSSLCTETRGAGRPRGGSVVSAVTRRAATSHGPRAPPRTGRRVSPDSGDSSTATGGDPYLLQRVTCRGRGYRLPPCLCDPCPGPDLSGVVFTFPFSVVTESSSGK